MEHVVDQITTSGQHSIEIIFIDDGQRDKTLQLIKQTQKEHSYVKYIQFSRNFGKEAGIYAGLQAQKGDYVAMMDADLQDPPELLLDMLKILDDQSNNHIDCVATRRINRKGEPPIRSWFAHKFYQLINKIQDANIMDGARDFRLMTRPMVDAILQMKEHNRFSKGIFGWVGFNTHWIDFENRERVAGQTKWSFWKLLIYAVDGIVDFSTALLNIPLVLTVLTAIMQIVQLICGLVKSSELFIGLGIMGIPMSLMFMCMQIFALYIKNIVGDTQNRPIYIVKEQVL